MGATTCPGPPILPLPRVMLAHCCTAPTLYKKLEEIRKERKENGGGTSGFEREFEGFGFLSENL